MDGLCFAVRQSHHYVIKRKPRIGYCVGGLGSRSLGPASGSQGRNVLTPHFIDEKPKTLCNLLKKSKVSAF